MFKISPHLSNDGLAAGATHAFRYCLHSQFVEVRLQTSQHVVQLVDLSGRTSGRKDTFPLSHDLKRSIMKNQGEDVGDTRVRMWSEGDMRQERSRFMPELEKTLDHSLFGSLQTPGLWEPLGRLEPLEEAPLGRYQRPHEAVWEQEVPGPELEEAGL